MGFSVYAWRGRAKVLEVPYFFRLDSFSIFKEFLSSPEMMHLGLMSINPEVGFTTLFPACYF
jgi:hypothetical protein